MKKSILVLATLFIAAISVQAQKFGYVNSMEILYSMPEAKDMDNQLSQRQKVLSDQLEKLYTEYYKKMDEYEQNSEFLSDAIRENMLKSLSDSEKNIRDFEGRAQKELADLEQKLTVPIQEKAMTAVKAVASDQGYTWVFDASSGAIVDAPESADLTPLVKAKLGIQ